MNAYSKYRTCFEIPLLLILIIFTCKIKSQDLAYSQFYAAPLQLNPALCGVDVSTNIYINYRNQWPALDNAFSTYAVGVSKYFPKMNSGLGFLLEADIAGSNVLSSYRGGLFYAYDVRFDKNYSLRMGLHADFVHKRLNWNQLIFFDQLTLANGSQDPLGNTNPSNEAVGKQNITYFDMGAGFLFNAPFLYAGLSLKHLTVPIESYINNNLNGSGEIPVQINIHAGSKINLKPNNKLSKQAFLSPNAMFILQGSFKQLNIGAYFIYDILLLGSWFRHTFTNSDALIFMAGIKKGMIRVIYSYDLTVSTLSPNSGGAHELSLMLSLFDLKKNHKNRYNDCLEIFR